MKEVGQKERGGEMRGWGDGEEESKIPLQFSPPERASVFPFFSPSFQIPLCSLLTSFLRPSISTSSANAGSGIRISQIHQPHLAPSPVSGGELGCVQIIAKYITGVLHLPGRLWLGWSSFFVLLSEQYVSK